MTRLLRQSFWPQAYRELPSTLYLFCCYLAYRQHKLGRPGNDAMAIRHSCAPYAFCPDGRPYADYQSPFMPYLTSFAVPHWYIDIYGTASETSNIFVDVFKRDLQRPAESRPPCLSSWTCEPQLALIVQALEALDTASADTDKRNRTRRVEAAHRQFFEACNIYERDKQERIGYTVVRDRFGADGEELEYIQLN